LILLQANAGGRRRLLARFATQTGMFSDERKTLVAIPSQLRKLGCANFIVISDHRRPFPDIIDTERSLRFKKISSLILPEIIFSGHRLF
jgi:hypothetical protein